MFTCPVCFFSEMPDAPSDYNICPCCGTEFGFDDEFRSFADLRHQWIAQGARWFFKEPPTNWNPWSQLIRIEVPFREVWGHVAFQPRIQFVAQAGIDSMSVLVDFVSHEPQTYSVEPFNGLINVVDANDQTPFIGHGVIATSHQLAPNNCEHVSDVLAFAS